MKKEKTAEINNERTTKKMIRYKTKIFKDTEQTAHAVADLIQAQSGQNSNPDNISILPYPAVLHRDYCLKCWHRSRMIRISVGM